ncbi:MAG: hypothetical protein DWQ31_03170 [Planctomycetota bacterium]|nr:MAG: hypothetical protein DWQ31_03170 [Planctomycetota bacterium]REJ90004.1 MAG: hypothetical protein DWQ35_17460 [Planctomycetota bacterium]REK28236.1 MAG: hypothetical protein DWQ42_05845 [Planctomycetota bacterium]REK39752.1 MAG: hypothetical protein DWQ46_17720 [Planctomycetota bacterium]
MCLLAIQLQVSNSVPLMLAANREEAYDRASTPPVFHDETPKVVCGIDQRAGGTWLGVNQYGLIVAVTNREKENLPSKPKSRGLLCRQLLQCISASVASRRAESHVARGAYAGVNVLCADVHSAFVTEGGDEVETIDLEPGLHLMATGNVDDEEDPRILLASEMFAAEPTDDAGSFLRVATKVMSYHAENPDEPSIVIHGEQRGTVSSTLITLANFRNRSTYHFAQGSPDRVPYRDCSPHLHKVLGV